MKVTVIVIGALSTVIVKGGRETIPISQNIKKSSEGLRRLAVSQTPVENVQETLVRKNFQIIIIIIMIYRKAEWTLKKVCKDSKKPKKCQKSSCDDIHGCCFFIIKSFRTIVFIFIVIFTTPCSQD